MLVQLFLVFALICLNGFFVAAEYALLGLRKTKVDQYARKRFFGYGNVKKALDNLFIVISATQLGSTLCSILIGWFGEPFIEGLLMPLIGLLPFQAGPLVDRSVSVVITIILLSFLQMIFGEIIPKTIALQRSELIARILIVPLNFFYLIFNPFIVLTNATANAVLKLFHFRHLFRKPVDYSQEEIWTILNESMKNRTLPLHQGQLLTSILALQHTSMKKLIIPQNKLVGFSYDDTVDEIKKKVLELKHYFNRYPIYFSKDLIVGYIHISDIFRYAKNGSAHKKISEFDIIKEILYINDTYPLDKLFVQMRAKNIHVAAVTTAEQELLGIVTLTGIVEFLVNHR